MPPTTSGLPEDVPTELAGLLLDRLAPAVVRCHLEVARRVGLEPVELTCVEWVRRCEPVTSARIGEQTGLGRSAVAKMLRRLEAAGHIERRPRPGSRQEVEVVLRPHPVRDTVLTELRERVRRAVASVVGPSLDPLVRGPLVASWVAAAAGVLHVEAQRLADATAQDRLLATRRTGREAEPWPPPWW